MTMTDLTEVLARVIDETVTRPIGPDDVQRIARAQLAAIDAAGYQIVPKEPTDEMCDAVSGYLMTHPSGLRRMAASIWEQMLAVARKSTSQSRG